MKQGSTQIRHVLYIIRADRLCTSIFEQHRCWNYQRATSLSSTQSEASYTCTGLCESLCLPNKSHRIVYPTEIFLQHESKCKDYVVIQARSICKVTSSPSISHYRHHLFSIHRWGRPFLLVVEGSNHRELAPGTSPDDFSVADGRVVDQGRNLNIICSALARLVVRGEAPRVYMARRINCETGVYTGSNKLSVDIYLHY